MAEQFSNKAETTLNGAIDDNDTTLVVTSATGFPTSGDFRIIIKAEGANTDEICTVTGVSGTTFTISRASEAVAGVQAASAHGDGATIAHVLTAGALQSFALPTGTIGVRTLASGSQVIGTGADTAIQYAATDIFDSDGFHDTSTNNTRMTVPNGLGGKYLVYASIVWTANATGTRGIQFRPNGSGTTGAATRFLATSGNSSATTAMEVIDLSGGDYIEVLGYQASGGDLTATYSTAGLIKLDSGRVGTGIGATAIASATTTVPNTTFTPVALAGAENFDTDGFHSTSSNTSRMTIPTGLGGIYLVTGSVEWDGNTIGERILILKQNNTTEYAWNRTVANTSVTGAGQVVAAVIKLAASDYVEMQAYQTSGADRTVASGNRTRLSIVRIDALPPTAQGQWQSYTPTLTNGTLGNGTVIGRWKYIDNKTIFWRFSWAFGSTSSVGGQLAISLPLTVTTGSTQTVNGYIEDSGTAFFAISGVVNSGGSTVAGVVCADSSGTRLVTTGVPITWAVNDKIILSGILELP